MKFTTINTSIGIDSKSILKQIENKDCQLKLSINAYIGEEDFDRHISINIAPEEDIYGFDIWLDLDIYQCELLAHKLHSLVHNRKQFLKNKMKE